MKKRKDLIKTFSYTHLALGLIFGTLIENIGLGLVIGLIFGSIFKEKNKSDK